MSDIQYRSTRSEAPPVSAGRAILAGLAPDGGLFVPTRLPSLPGFLLDPSASVDWPEAALAVLAPFFPRFPRAALRAAIEAAAARFDSPLVAPLSPPGGSGRRFLELFHGPTLAFKDVALSLMGGLLALAREEEDAASGAGRKAAARELLVLTATSGDTGKAALAGLAGAPGVRVMVFYPAEGTSEIQRLQMVTHATPGSAVVGVRGSFDDAQRGVKELFARTALRDYLDGRGIALGSANSINIGRLLPQIVYYVTAWRALRAEGALGAGELLDAVVPTGNFGDILAAHWARRMGLPLGKLVVASNANRVLPDFFASGTYDRNRPFRVTTSPSMDILVSSNLERLVFEATGGDSARVATLMGSLASVGSYGLAARERAALEGFLAGSADEAEAAAEIGRTFHEEGYLLDPHAAVAAAVERRLRESGRIRGPSLVLATASPFKFPATVARAIGLGPAGSELDTAGRLADRAGLDLPRAVSLLRGAPVLHEALVDPAGMEEALRRFAAGGRP